MIGLELELLRPALEPEGVGLLPELLEHNTTNSNSCTDCNITDSNTDNNVSVIK